VDRNRDGWHPLPHAARGDSVSELPSCEEGPESVTARGLKNAAGRDNQPHITFTVNRETYASLQQRIFWH
jgi:hypothetical protein